MSDIDINEIRAKEIEQLLELYDVCLQAQNGATRAKKIAVQLRRLGIAIPQSQSKEPSVKRQRWAQQRHQNNSEEPL